jgi:hypothetical protein
MKNLNAIVALLAIVLAFSAAKAADDDNGKFTRNYAISTYVDAITEGKLDGLEEILYNSTKFCLLQNKKTAVNYSKTEMLEYMKANLKNVKQMCITTTTVVEDNPGITLLKIDIRYSNFLRTNYVTIANTGNGWKITNVCSVFK